MATLIARPSPISPTAGTGDAEQLIKARDGDPDAFESLLRKYGWLVRARARQFFLQGGEFEDLLQEGMIGFYKGIRDYRPARGAFLPFAEMCITRQVITAIKTASRLKHYPLNTSRSIDEPVFEDGRLLYRDVISLRNGPGEIDIFRDQDFEHLLKILRKNLTAFQFGTLALWLQGYSYQEIADRLGRHTKAIDNGLTSIKDKVRKLQEKGILPRSIQ